MDLRAVSRNAVAAPFFQAMHRLNSRHPWNHNAAFHPWIATRLPTQRTEALDVGCGRGELLALLAEQFDHVHGIDVDLEMREASSARCAGLPNVTVDETSLPDVPAGADLITMVAVLHHLDIGAALREVRRILNPGGRFLCVGLAPPETAIDVAWDVASMITNPIIGYVRHPWPAEEGVDGPRVPVKDPEVPFDQLRAEVRSVMPGAEMSRHLAFRHTISWAKPA